MRSGAACEGRKFSSVVMKFVVSLPADSPGQVIAVRKAIGELSAEVSPRCRGGGERGSNGGPREKVSGNRRVFTRHGPGVTLSRSFLFSRFAESLREGGENKRSHSRAHNRIFRKMRN